jgi:hypothetical protein
VSALPPLLDAPPLERYGLVPVVEPAASPAAGASFVFDIEGRYYLRLLTLAFTVVTSADVADRYIALEYRNAANQRFAVFGAPVAQTAGTTTEYLFNAWQNQAEWPVSAGVIVQLGPILLPPGYDFAITATNMAATDAISAVRFMAERFFTG